MLALRREGTIGFVFNDTYLAKKLAKIANFWKNWFANFASFLPSFFYGWSPSPSLASFFGNLDLICSIWQVFSNPNFQKLAILASFHGVVKKRPFFKICWKSWKSRCLRTCHTACVATFLPRPLLVSCWLCHIHSRSRYSTSAPTVASTDGRGHEVRDGREKNMPFLFVRLTCSAWHLSHIEQLISFGDRLQTIIDSHLMTLDHSNRTGI